MTRRIFTRLAILASCISLGFLAPSTYASAYDWSVIAHVTDVEGSYTPGHITFKIDKDASSQCPQGTFLAWNMTGADEAQQIANANAVYSLLMTALATGKSVTIYGYNSGCVLSFVHILNS